MTVSNKLSKDAPLSSGNPCTLSSELDGRHVWVPWGGKKIPLIHKTPRVPVRLVVCVLLHNLNPVTLVRSSSCMSPVFPVAISSLEFKVTCFDTDVQQVEREREKKVGGGRLLSLNPTDAPSSRRHKRFLKAKQRRKLLLGKHSSIKWRHCAPTSALTSMLCSAMASPAPVLTAAQFSSSSVCLPLKVSASSQRLRASSNRSMPEEQTGQRPSRLNTVPQVLRKCSLNK